MRIASTVLRNALVVGSAIAAAFTLSQHADARTVMAGAATATDLDIDCFSPWYGSLTNSCAVKKTIEIPLVVDNGGAKTVTVTGYSGDTSKNVGCRAEGYWNSNVLYSHSGMQYLPGFHTNVNIVLSGAYVPGGGTLMVTCSLDPGTRISIIDWNP
jgi:hypothetical protein